MRKNVVYRFATSTANYPSTGSHFAWEGHPIHFGPATDYIIPGTVPGAQYMNHLWWAAGQTQQNLLDQVGTISVHNWPGAITTTDNITNFTNRDADGTWVLQTTSGGGTVTWLAYVPGIGALALPTSGAPSATNAKDDICANPAGTLVVTKTDTITANTPLAGTSYTLGTVWATHASAPTGQCHTLHWYKAGSKFLCASVAQGLAYHWLTTSPDGVTWTDHTSTANFDLQGNYAKGVFASDTSGVNPLVMYFLYDHAGALADHYYTSADGITWTQRTSPATGSTERVIGAAWDVDTQLWVALIQDLISKQCHLATSLDGVSWLVGSTFLTSVTNSSSYITSLAVSGSMWVVLRNSGQAADRYEAYYSVDQGTFWRKCIGYGYAYVAAGVTSIKTNNNQFLTANVGAKAVRSSAVDGLSPAVT